jgi:asparagine synthase (glutamine-hydrolysing)
VGEGGRVIFTGRLSNRETLLARLGGSDPRAPSDAEVVAQAYRRWGDDALGLLRGAFAVIIWDRERDRLLCARDPMGMHPLFYAQAGSVLLLSPSIEALLGHPGVPAEINRIALAERLIGRLPQANETYWAHVMRIPLCHALRIDREGQTAYRYWDPAPLERPVVWVPDGDAVEHFSVLFEQAVERSLESEPAGIFLSGGLDSCAVAMVAADLCQRHGWTAPRALSLVEIAVDPDEEAGQRWVAESLSLPHETSSYADASGGAQVLTTALELSASMPAPLLDPRRIPTLTLARVGQQGGCRAILTGDGGDEWLGVSPSVAADLLRTVDLLSIYCLWLADSRSNGPASWAGARRLLWSYGARPLIRQGWRTSIVRLAARNLTAQIAPGLLDERRRRLIAATIVESTPSWLAPDSTLRAQLDRREVARWNPGVDESASFHQRNVRWKLDDPGRSMAAEESFLLAQRIGVQMQLPFWDADLIALLVRTRHKVLSGGGRAKALIRAPLARRFPELGFERQRKLPSRYSLWSHTSAQASPALQKLGGLRALAELGVVNPTLGVSLASDLRDGSWQGGPKLLFDLLNLEVWSQAHLSAGHI